MASQAAKGLVTLLKSSRAKTELRVAACRALAVTGYRGGGTGLAEIVRDDADQRVVAEVALFLEAARLRGAEAVLAEAVAGSRPENASAAAVILGAVGRHRAVTALKRAFLRRDLPPAVRGDIAEALGRIGDKRAVPVLTSALEDEAPEVRFFAAYALGRVGDSRATSALQVVAREDAGVVKGYGRVDREARSALRAIARAQEPPRQKSSARTARSRR